MSKNCDNKETIPAPSDTSANTDWRKDFWSLENGEENDDDIDLEELSRAFSEAASLSSHPEKEITHQSEATLRPLSASPRIRDVDRNTPGVCLYKRSLVLYIGSFLLKKLRRVYKLECRLRRTFT